MLKTESVKKKRRKKLKVVCRLPLNLIEIAESEERQEENRQEQRNQEVAQRIYTNTSKGNLCKQHRWKQLPLICNKFPSHSPEVVLLSSNQMSNV